MIPGPAGWVHRELDAPLARSLKFRIHSSVAVSLEDSPKMLALDFSALADRANADPEFSHAARDWRMQLQFAAGDDATTLRAVDGAIEVVAADTPLGPHDLRISAAAEDWEKVLAPTPPPGWNGVYLTRSVTVTGDLLDFGPYYPAIRRLVDLMREQLHGPKEFTPPARVSRKHDDAVGRYVYLDVAGTQYRVYYEEAGAGIPLLLLHTAGTDGRLWRHVLENRNYQQKYRMIAMDLPYHGKSLPPTGKQWWTEQYRLTGDFLLEFFDAFVAALDLQRPAFMGCSVGGLFAPTLAAQRPGQYRAVIGLNGALAIPQEHRSTPEKFSSWDHPRVSDEWKASGMTAFMSPTSPEVYRRETSWLYSQGAPPIFAGDTNYYMHGHDLTAEQASTIDTAKTGVYLFTGEYDRLALTGGSQELASAIPGSHFEISPGTGHFQPSENPDALMVTLDPILDEIAVKYPD
jgi:pimeloyl-ACP methyl ester carboxylesterase